MIKRLRLKLICVSMSLVTVLLAVILVLICRFTWVRMETQSIAILQSAAKEGPGHDGHGDPDLPTDPALPGAPGPIDRGPGMVQPSSRPVFLLFINPQGQLEAVGNNYYDLSDTQLLQQIFDAAQKNGKCTDVLYDYSLRFYKLEGGPVLRYAFLDISEEISTVRGLILSCICLGIAAFGLLFAMMWALSKWMVRPVEEAWVNQRQFVADASHELKTPLTVIMTNAELLQSEEYDAAAKQRYAGSIHTMSVQMRGLVESLLDLARIDSGIAHKQMGRIDLSALVEQATLPFEAVYFEAGRSLESSIATGIFLPGSESHLRQVVEILLDNGCKYSSPGTPVVLKLQKQSSRALLTVASQGAPMTAQQCKDIFKRFYRVDEARKMNHSYGLGLSIAQAIVEDHKGKIWCESKDGTNTFYVNLPL